MLSSHIKNYVANYRSPSIKFIYSITFTIFQYPNYPNVMASYKLYIIVKLINNCAQLPFVQLL